MPQAAALIASLILERPLCIPCIAAKTGTTAKSVQALFAHIAPVVWYGERCQSCGQAEIVVSLIRRSAA